MHFSTGRFEAIQLQNYSVLRFGITHILVPERNFQDFPLSWMSEFRQKSIQNEKKIMLENYFITHFRDF